MELRQLNYFVGVANELHFGRAAKKLFISQPALSQQIKLLEGDLGIELFVGIKRKQLHKVELTQAGIAFLVDAKRILQMAEKAVRNARQISTRQQVIRLGFFKLILPERVMGMLELFSTHFPTVEVNIVELPSADQVQEGVVTDRIDLGMSVLPLTQTGLVARQYAETDYSLLMNRNHPLALQQGVKLVQLAHEKWIDHGRENGLFFGQLEEICHQANFSREGNIVQVVPSFDLLKSMVRLGRGIAFIPASLALEQEPLLVSMPILNSDDTPFKEIVIQHVLIHKSDRPSSLTQTLAGLLKSPITLS